jgi:hypothetical protein
MYEGINVALLLIGLWVIGCWIYFIYGIITLGII